MSDSFTQAMNIQSPTQGKITFGILFVSLAIITGALLVGNENPRWVLADNATTSVTVLNTPADWTIDAEEVAGSSTTTPTNAGSTVSWDGTATDPNGAPYYLLICKTSAAPTPSPTGVPSCDGGLSNRWAVSTLTNSGVEAVATYTTQASDPESNDWYAWICDEDDFNPRCNGTFKQGTGTTSSPFEVNHRPTLTTFTDDSPKNPGEVVEWTTVASDADVSGAQDTIQLFVCKANDFTGTDCGAGGTYGTSSFVVSNATTSFTLEIPKQDTDYAAYGFIIDNHGFAASGGAHGSNSIITVSNVAPTIASSSISVLDVDESGGLTLATESGQTTGFKVRFTITDNNSCQTATSANEFASSLINVYRSGVGSSSCQLSGDYDANDCYPAAVGLATWNYSCSQDGASCSGASDFDATWTCTFPLWHIADPTDGSSLTDSTWFAENWLATVLATDDDGATSPLTQAATGNDVLSFLAYDLNTSTISYGSLEPGQQNDPIVATTTFSATGNVGVDQTLYGTDMCTTYPTCTGNPTSTVAVGEQKYATTTTTYAGATALLANPGAELEVNVQKSTSTSTPANKNTYWGIRIPVAITLAGDYTGQNTFIGVKGEAENW